MGFTSRDMSCLIPGGAESFVSRTTEISHDEGMSTWNKGRRGDKTVLIKIYLQLLIYLCHCTLQPFDLQNKLTGN